MNQTPTKQDIHSVLDGLSTSLSVNIGYISNALFVVQKELDIDSEDILAIITSLAVIRDSIDSKVEAIKRVMNADIPPGVEF